MKINFLPRWVETNIQPAFYDLASGTCLQQTSRMYNKVNELIRIANEQNETIADYIQQFIDLRTYVDDYFTNLDVQEEINKKLDEMSQDGTLGSLITSYIQPYVNNVEIRIDAVETDVNALKYSYGAPLKASTVAGMTNTNRIYVYTGSEVGYTAGNWYYYDGNDWVSGGVYQSASVQTDPTLKVAGESADAMYTGFLKKSIAPEYDTITKLFVRKTRNNSTGVYSNTTTRLTTSDFVRFDHHVRLACGGSYEIGTWCKTDPTDEDSPAITAIQWTRSATLLPNVDYIVVLRHSSETSDITLDEAIALTAESGCFITADNKLPRFLDEKIYVNLNTFVNEGYYIVANWYNNSLYEPINTPTDEHSNFIVYCEDQYQYDNNSFITQRLYYYNLDVTYERLMNRNGTVRNDWVRIKPVESIKKGKKLSIYGDSITTYAGWIPTGNASYYNGNNAGISNVNQTWWKETIDALGYDLLINNSWSGRAVSSVRDTQSGHTTDAGYKQENIDVLGDNGTPDEIIIKLGINDFNSGCELGDYDGSTVLPNDPTKFTDAYAIMLDRILTTYPQAKVYCCTLMQCERSGSTGFPEINSRGDSLLEWNEAIKKLALAFGCSIIDHASCGITYYNLSTYMGDYDSQTGKGLHPNASGMALIANNTINQLDNAVRKRY